MNLFTKQKWSHRCRKQIYGYQGGNGRRDKLGDCHIVIYRMELKIYCSSTGNTTQYSVMAYLGKSKKEWIYVYV